MMFLIALVLAYSMTKGVVIALIYFLVFLWDLFVMGLVLSDEDLIKTTKDHIRSICWKLKSHASLEDFASVSQVKPLLEIVAKHSAWRIFIVTFLPFTYAIYTLITHKFSGGHFRKKTLDGFSTTHTYPSFWEKATHP